MNNKATTTPINIDSMFLGTKSENEETFTKNLMKLFIDHSQWRKNFHPEDPNIINKADMCSESFLQSTNKMEDALDELSSKLRTKMMPWHSPRYLGHMNSETLMPALLGYFAGMLYNGNNIAYEGSPATSELENELAYDFCHLMGYDDNIGWGHLTPDGSTANYEAVWYMRNIKSIPFALKDVAPDLIIGKSDWQLLNMSISEIMDILDQIPQKLDDIKAYSARFNDKEIPLLGKLIVPETKHYSWLKAADILGVGINNIIEIEVDDHFRMRVDKLKEAIDSLVEQKIPVLGVVSVVGTTEEGSVDYVDKVALLRSEYSQQGINFYYHVDAAYGGYMRSIFLDEDYNFIPFNNIHDKYSQYNIFQNEKLDWPCLEVYNAYKAMNQADSITVDPHKMGYIPYKAGGIVIRDKRMRNTISYFSNYAFQKDTSIPDLLGAFVFEGSKAGAAAASVWVCHKILPLNITGYGRLIGASIEGAQNFYNKLVNTEYDINGIALQVHPLVKPDTNMVNYVFNLKGNASLAVMNQLNTEFYKCSSYYTEAYLNDLIVSHTEFDYSDYKDSPVELISRSGIARKDWDDIHKVTLIRSCVVTPYYNKPEVCSYYFDQFDHAVEHKFSAILKEGNFQ
ncbi:tyrosine decarboxylase [Photobacterium kishitanii]|uniref:pyridoxal phosphate-dependent decarboxylase family protein n=1 Tax=Photobacterium kishitanii TaxID=318456 RepID=UPI0005D30E73|nr:pyridoxal-dependent decarboxylase [Photobacterium kishitanii]KJG10225.1 decarboxylase [Photobacterium kishitanii]PSV06978.1 tyrosine decarboxylase [Photobacterium kishitanii]PSV14506.1 tyrosine decarboxylase [Photobacterium kishitanii]PSV78002.1 tyrosine decarboxylase [Photobacterium kishitanii]